MEIFSTLLALCAGNSPVAGEFPSQRPVTRSFYVFFDLRNTFGKYKWQNVKGGSRIWNFWKPGGGGGGGD